MLYGTGKFTYELVDGWAKCPEELSFPDVNSISIDSQDKVHLLTSGSHAVMVFDHEGNFLTSWGEGFFGRAHGGCVGPDDCVYCADDKKHTVSKYTSDGKLLMTLGNKDQPSDTGYVRRESKDEKYASIKRGGPPFNRPTDVALSSSGEIYVSDGEGNARVHKFSPNGTLLFSWGEPGTAPGQFRIPHAVLVDKDERVLVVDRQNNRIQIFNAQGEFLSQWTDIKDPSDIFVDSEETVYVSEQSRRVSIFTIDGELVTRWGSEGQNKETALFVTPHAIAVDSHGDIYVGENSMSHGRVNRGPRTLQKFVRRA